MRSTGSGQIGKSSDQRNGTGSRHGTSHQSRLHRLRWGCWGRRWLRPGGCGSAMRRTELQPCYISFAMLGLQPEWLAQLAAGVQFCTLVSVLWVLMLWCQRVQGFLKLG